MKKVIAFALMLALVLSCGVLAFADVKSEVSPAHSDTATAPAGPAPIKGRMSLEVYDKDDKMIDTVPRDKVVLAQVGQANQLPAADKEAFLKAYEDAKAVKDRVVKYFFWLGTEDYTKPADFSYYKYAFNTTGKNVSVQVNGKDMEVVNVQGNSYYAKLTELGAVAILCD